MPSEDKMPINERFQYLRRAQKQYLKATRQERTQLLNHMQHITGLNRKTLIRHMNSKIERKPRKRQRGKTYGPKVDDALRVISETLDHICAERITPQLVPMAKHLAAHGELEVSAELLNKLECISISTVRRRLSKFAHLQQWRLPRRQGPRQSNPLTRDIPMKRIPWDEQVPGHFEVDLVHHCGRSSSGQYVHTVQMIDVATGWSERAAVLGRSQLVIEDAFLHFITRLPFKMLQLHPDNGSEFFNHHLLRLWKEMVKGVKITRSRPFHKNDNRFVEQKNATLVRAYLSDARFDTVQQTRLLNQLYDKMWLYYNFFQPVLRMTEKTVLSAPGQAYRVRRRYGPAQTPFQRLCATGVLPDARRQRLEDLRDRTNPRSLRREIYEMLDQLFSLPGADPNTTEDVYRTLTMLPKPA
jgi:hypothetical protein